MPTVALTEVAVRATPRQMTLRAPGEAKGLHDALAMSLTPTSRLAVWHPNPDSARTYRIRAVRVRLGSRMPENMTDLARQRRRFLAGRLALRLSPATAAGAPTDRNLLATPLLLTPEESARHAHGWVRFDVADQRLTVPAGGLFVVAEGLTSGDDEQFVNHRSLVRPADGKTPLEDLSPTNRRANGKGTTVFLYEEIQPAGGGASRLISSHHFPAVAHRTVSTPGECRTWRWSKWDGRQHSWKSVAAQHAEIRQRSPTLTNLTDSNYDLELEVEEL